VGSKSQIAVGVGLPIVQSAIYTICHLGEVNDDDHDEAIIGVGHVRQTAVTAKDLCCVSMCVRG